MADRKPLGIKILTVLWSASGIYRLFVGVMAAGFGASYLLFYGGDGANTAEAIHTTAAGAWGIVTGLVSMAVAWGFWKGKKWAWWAGVLLYALAVPTTVMLGISCSVPRAGVICFWYFFKALIGAVILWYLFRPHVREYFGVKV